MYQHLLQHPIVG